MMSGIAALFDHYKQFKTGVSVAVALISLLKNIFQ